MAGDHGTFLLRFEDIDTTRVRGEFYQAIEEDLRWLGLNWSEAPLRQTNRSAAYEGAMDTLRENGFAYPCFCTRREIQAEWDRMANAPHGPEGPNYPGTCRTLSARERARRIAAGEPHAWRLDSCKAAATCGPLVFTDRRFGIVPVDPALLGDVVLSRKDIGPAYHLAVVVDDAFQEITLVTRGEDLLASTHVHRILQALLQLPESSYFHHPLVFDASGKRLAKRHDSLSIRALRTAGKSPSDALEMARPQQIK